MSCEPVTLENQQCGCASQGDSDQPRHQLSLTRVFAVCMQKPHTKSTMNTLIRLGGCLGWSESLLSAHPFCWFGHVFSFKNSEVLVQSSSQIRIQTVFHWTSESIKGLPDEEICIHIHRELVLFSSKWHSFCIQVQFGFTCLILQAIEFPILSTNHTSRHQYSCPAIVNLFVQDEIKKFVVVSINFMTWF